MKSIQYCICVLFLTTTCNLAQGQTTAHLFYLGSGPFSLAHVREYACLEKVFQSRLNFGQVPLAYDYNAHIAAGAVFCRLENHVCKRYNIWLKIRAGDTDIYHRMIEKKE